MSTPEVPTFTQVRLRECCHIEQVDALIKRANGLAV